MRHFIFVAALALAPALAPAAGCDKAESTDRITKAQEAGIILGYKMQNGMPMLFVDRATWEQLDLNARTSMALHFQCAAMGHGQVLREMTVADSGGLPLAKWDGVSSSLEIIR